VRSCLRNIAAVSKGTYWFSLMKIITTISYKTLVTNNKKVEVVEQVGIVCHAKQIVKSRDCDTRYEIKNLI